MGVRFTVALSCLMRGFAIGGGLFFKSLVGYVEDSAFRAGEVSFPHIVKGDTTAAAFDFIPSFIRHVRIFPLIPYNQN